MIVRLKPLYTNKRLLRYVLFMGVILCVLVSISAFWVYSVFFNTEKFSTITTAAVTKESSRSAISKKVVEYALEDRPMVQATIGPRIESLVTNALGSDLANGIFRKLVESLQIYVTTPRSDPIIIDLRQVKPLISSAHDLLERNTDGRDIDIQKIPDSIVLLDTNRLPNFYKQSVAVLWLGLLTLVLAIIASGIWVRRGGKKNLTLRLMIISFLVVIACVIAQVSGPLVKPSFLSIARDAPSQTLLANLYDGFMGPFMNSTRLVGALALMAIGILYGIRRLSMRYRLVIKVEQNRK